MIRSLSVQRFWKTAVIDWIPVYDTSFTAYHKPCIFPQAQDHKKNVGMCNDVAYINFSKIVLIAISVVKLLWSKKIRDGAILKILNNHLGGNSSELIMRVCQSWINCKKQWLLSNWPPSLFRQIAAIRTNRL